MKITFNGQSIEVPDGSNISILNDQVIIGGRSYEGKGINKLIVEGNAGDVRTDNSSVEVRRNVTGNISCGGSVSCGDVGGNINNSGSVSCGDVNGSVKAGGSISCGDIYNGKIR